jgi:predicted dehydrogenase
MLRVGVVGVGHLGRHHARIYAAMPTVQLVGIADINSERGQELAAEYRTTYYQDYRALIPQVDAISLAVPTTAHCEIACEFLMAGVAVLVEKPIACTLAQADQMIALAKAKGVCLQVGHLERFNPAVVAVRELVTTPRFFEVHRLSLFSPRSLDIDVVMDLMIHDLDIINYLVQSPLTNISAVGVPVISPRFDIANARLEFANGCIANITASRISNERTRKLRLFQPNDYISLDYLHQQAGIWSLRPAAGMPVIETRALPITKDEPLRLEIAAFVTAVTQQQPPLVDGQQGRVALDLALTVSDRIATAAQNIVN